jgi:hypothetical protein
MRKKGEWLPKQPSVDSAINYWLAMVTVFGSVELLALPKVHRKRVPALLYTKRLVILATWNVAELAKVAVMVIRPAALGSAMFATNLQVLVYVPSVTVKLREPRCFRMSTVVVPTAAPTGQALALIAFATLAVVKTAVAEAAPVLAPVIITAGALK